MKYDSEGLMDDSVYEDTAMLLDEDAISWVRGDEMSEGGMKAIGVNMT